MCCIYVKFCINHPQPSYICMWQYLTCNHILANCSMLFCAKPNHFSCLQRQINLAFDLNGLSINVVICLCDDEAKAGPDWRRACWDMGKFIVHYNAALFALHELLKLLESRGSTRMAQTVSLVLLSPHRAHSCSAPLACWTTGFFSAVDY